MNKEKKDSVITLRVSKEVKSIAIMKAKEDEVSLSKVMSDYLDYYIAAKRLYLIKRNNNKN